MPRTQGQRLIFALLTVIITVHAFVFYNLYVVSGENLLEATGANSVLEALAAQGGVYMFGTIVPIWVVIIVEFALAYLLEIFIGSPKSFKMASKMFNPMETNPTIFETAIICSTVLIMCPMMSGLAAIMYYPFYEGFNVLTLLANWIKLICFNFPFALFGQLFFIQPVVRRIFGFLFCKDIAAREFEREEVVEDNLTTA